MKGRIVLHKRDEKVQKAILNDEFGFYMYHCTDKGTTYEFRVSAKNDVDYGERAVVSLTTPDGGWLSSFSASYSFFSHCTVLLLRCCQQFYVFISLSGAMLVGAGDHAFHKSLMHILLYI